MFCWSAKSNPTYRYFAQEAHISHAAINLSAGLRVKGAVHIQNVNAYHGRLKQWLNGSMAQWLNGSMAFTASPPTIWTITWAGFVPWTTTTPTLGKVSWLWLLGSFHI